MWDILPKFLVRDSNITPAGGKKGADAPAGKPDVRETLLIGQMEIYYGFNAFLKY